MDKKYSKNHAIRFYFTIILLFSSHFFGQKQHIQNSESIMAGISPSHNIKQWKIIAKKYASEKILNSKGDFFHTPQFNGIKFNPNDQQYYYLAYIDEKEVKYITELPQLIEIIGNIDSIQEAILLAMNHNYFPDFEHNDFAGNYQILNGEFLIELSKITSQKCPLAKNNFLIAINPKTKNIKEIKNISQYFVIYDKDCENHPQKIEIAKQVEEVRLKNEEKAQKQKEINEKMERRIRKIQMKNNR